MRMFRIGMAGVTILAAAIGWAGLATAPSAFAADGDLLGTVDLPGQTGTAVAGTLIPMPSVAAGVVYVTTQGYYPLVPQLRIYEPPSGGNGTATLLATKDFVDGDGNPVDVSCVAWDPLRMVLWGAHSATDSVYQIQLGGPTVSGDALTTFQFNPGQSTTTLCDGLAYDEEEDTLWYSPDVNHSVYEYGLGAPSSHALGALLSTVSPQNDIGEEDGRVSGVVVGTANTLYVARNGDAEIRRVDKTTGAFVSNFATTSGRVEDLACDPVTYAPLEAILAKDAYNALYEAFEVEPGTCPLPGEGPDINIHPNSDPNSINVCSNGNIPVTIWGSDMLDVTTIIPEQLVLASSAVKTVGKSDRSLCSIADVGSFDDTMFDSVGFMDGFDDMTCHFLTVNLNLNDASTEAELQITGCDDPAFSGDPAICEPTDPGYFETSGTDSVNIVKDCP